MSDRRAGVLDRAPARFFVPTIIGCMRDSAPAGRRVQRSPDPHGRRRGSRTAVPTGPHYVPHHISDRTRGTRTPARALQEQRRVKSALRMARRPNFRLERMGHHATHDLTMPPNHGRAGLGHATRPGNADPGDLTTQCRRRVSIAAQSKTPPSGARSAGRGRCQISVVLSTTGSYLIRASS